MKAKLTRKQKGAEIVIFTMLIGGLGIPAAIYVPNLIQEESANYEQQQNIQEGTDIL